MKRATIYANEGKGEGKVILIEGSLENILEECSLKLGFQVSKLYTVQGGLLTDQKLIHNDDVLYAVGSANFVAPKAGSTTTGASSMSHFKAGGVLPAVQASDWVTLNVGGKVFMTTRCTLTTKAPESMLACMFSDQVGHQWCSSVDESGAYLIDRSPVYFEPILNYLRHGELIVDKNTSLQGVLAEARFFGITALVDILEEKIEEEKPLTETSPITRREFIKILMSTTAPDELRCQGVDFSNINLSKLDLRGINFKFAQFQGANLTGANFSECNLERADLSNSCCDMVNFLGARMLCANLENASMRGCNFEDPAGKQTYLEGANLKFVNLEGSHMAGVNMRVATLRKANLQNCDLRGAILAGADLEDADLTGSDLQEANLRGANLNGAYLELIVNPLHMSQTIR